MVNGRGWEIAGERLVASVRGHPTAYSALIAWHRRAIFGSLMTVTAKMRSGEKWWAGRLV